MRFDCCYKLPLAVTMRSKAVRLRLLDFWGRGFESRTGHGFSSLVFLLYVAVQRSPNVCVCNGDT